MLWGKDAGGSTSKCKSNGATVVGLWVVYEIGLEGYGVYGVTSSNWDASTVASSLVNSSGFLASCGAPDYLYTQIGTVHAMDGQRNVHLPMAWTLACTNTFTNNFDLDHTVDYGSNWRAESGGWNRVRLRFYCSSSAVPCPDGKPPPPPPTAPAPCPPLYTSTSGRGCCYWMNVNGNEAQGHLAMSLAPTRGSNVLVVTGTA